ncbi:MAG: restriction endonuclease subunit S, partial [Ruthenibacterium sp.]
MNKPFIEVFDDCTKYAKKIQTSDFLRKGKYAIIDQSQEYISGYANNEEGLYDKYPVIIFGDHTRIIKYIDFPFFLGADGTKILQPKIH